MEHFLESVVELLKLNLLLQLNGELGVLKLKNVQYHANFQDSGQCQLCLEYVLGNEERENLRRGHFKTGIATSRGHFKIFVE